MRFTNQSRAFWGAAFFMLSGAALGDPLPAERLEVQVGDAPRAALSMPEGAEICLRWNHSVTGGAVADCFAHRGGDLLLVSSYLHDYAAGLGDLPGRGTIAPAPGGGYLITGIDEVMADRRVVLRVGSARVDQRLEAASGWISLPALAARGERVVLQLVVENDGQPAEQKR
ncbi:MAG: DUF1850 domain-containing protein [Paracoccus sp. (in: a-proteobacteria)]|nr:DUF1850 domain-containing protein [Paracoccus sp. (in: a-proteobacteria)]